VRLASHLGATTEKVESTVTEKVVQGVGKLKALEHDVHLRVKQFQRKVAMLAVAMLVAILGIGVWALAGYNAFKEIMSPAWAAFVTGSVLFVICGLLLYFGTHPKVLRYKLDRVRS
jgi:uncharacterized membrane protein